MEMGYRAYARHRGVTLGAVQKAIKTGRISVNERNKIDSEEADCKWDENTDSSRVDLNVLQDKPKPQLPLVPAAPPQPIDSTVPLQPDSSETTAKSADEVTGADKTADKYREHRASREEFQALKEKLEYEQLVGKLIDVEDAKRIVYTAFRALRDGVLNVVPRIKDQLAAISDPYEVERLLEEELSVALEEIDLAKLIKEDE